VTEPRIAPLTDPSPEVAEILGMAGPPDRPPLNIFTTLANHPRLLKRFNVLGGLFLGRVALAGFYGMVSCVLNAARVQRESGTPGWPSG